MYPLSHSCQVSRNDRDSPGIFAFVPVVSRLTQKAGNVPDFSQTLSSRAHRWHILSQQKTYKPGRRKKVAFGTVLSTEPFVISIFRRGIIARHAPQRRSRGVVNDFRARETQIYQLSRLTDLETWHLCCRDCLMAIERDACKSLSMSDNQILCVLYCLVHIKKHGGI